MTGTGTQGSILTSMIGTETEYVVVRGTGAKGSTCSADL